LFLKDANLLKSDGRDILSILLLRAETARLRKTVVRKFPIFRAV